MKTIPAGGHGSVWGRPSTSSLWGSGSGSTKKGLNNHYNSFDVNKNSI